MEETVPSVEAYEAAMVLSGVGDALGYRGGRWEYCTSGPQIHAELAELGGLEAITLEPPEWPVSDDTVLHLATAEGLATGLEGEPLLQELARRYVAAMGDMEGRKPGPTSILGTSQLRPGEPEGYRIPFNPRGTGCGAAMRSLAIGLRYPHAWELPTLIRGTSGHWQWPSLGHWGLGESPQSAGGLSCCGSCPWHGTTWRALVWLWRTMLLPGPSLGRPGTGEGSLGRPWGDIGSTRLDWGGYWEGLRGHWCHWCPLGSVPVLTAHRTGVTADPDVQSVYRAGTAHPVPAAPVSRQ
ncbi:protein ADP-ribosylarginine hydrolase-like isoform X2 [Pipra filicauda]|uniref:Protein ADP-ribosylarginine hydrolase-like isoform X2 n=1 Tax=Pipra filicauda TaxID=649802 RepID=A0A7R5KIB8_9PASS|nr:protein ADP-ribosylarginine hydrolase-like isoform X2 [Pipra filicauda]